MYEYVTSFCKVGNKSIAVYRPSFHIEYNKNLRRGSQLKKNCQNITFLYNYLFFWFRGRNKEPFIINQ